MKRRKFLSFLFGAKEGDRKPFTVCAIIEETCVPLLGILS